MNGYLQRLVSTAKGTGSSVHPLVKPVFSSASPDQPALSPKGDNVKFASASRRANGIAPEVSTEFADPSTEAPAQVYAWQQTEREQPNLGETNINDIEQKLLQPATKVTVTNLQPPLTSNRPPFTLQGTTRSAEPASRAVEPLKQRTQAEQSRDPATKTPVYVPLLNTTPSLSRSESIETQTPVHAGARISQQKARRSSAAAATNGSDEIQIHIGRIEVTAVPPPAATPKPKRAPKGLSLQEYLGRRDRRGS